MMSLSKKKFIFILSLWGILVPAALIVFNYQQDPSARYHLVASDGDLLTLARSSDQLLIVPENYDDRSLLSRYIRTIPTPSFVLMGGSRVLNISEGMLRPIEREHFLNAGVTSGTYKDYVALWGLLKAVKKVPRRVVLCLDLQGMSRLSQNELWRPLAGSRMAIGMQLKDLTAYQTTLSALKMLGKARASFSLVVGGDFDSDAPVRSRSFSLRYPEAYEHRALEAVLLAGQSNGDGETKAFRAWSQEDHESFERLKEMLQDMKREGVVPYLVLMPYHPEAMKRLSADPGALKNMLKFKERLARMAKTCDVPFYDGYEDGRQQLSSSDFADGVHLKATHNRAFFKRADKALHMGLFE